MVGGVVVGVAVGERVVELDVGFVMGDYVCCGSSVGTVVRRGQIQ
jgi:hypothetical protein